MIDILNIPTNSDYISIYYSTVTALNRWQAWSKPKNCKFVYIVTIGAGGGGAGGTTTSNTARTAGGSGAIMRSLYPAHILPDTLYVSVGRGGPGGASNAVGTSGGRTVVSWYGSTESANLTSHYLAYSDGGSGGSTSVSFGGAGGTAFTSAFGGLTFGTFLSNAGASALTTYTAGTNFTPFSAALPLSSGAYGGRYVTSTSAANGNGIGATTENLSPLIAGGIGSTVGNGGNGNNGRFSLAPFYSIGGSGGGGSMTGTGGRGGNGAYGSGGGSGGCGPVAGGQGGTGGDGLAIIIAI
jgi:hypothetical protein